MKSRRRERYGVRGQGSLMLREGVANWYFVYSHRGKPHEESTGSPDLKQARRFVKDKLEKLGAARQGLGKFQPPLAARSRVCELLDDLETDYRLRQVKSRAQIASHLRAIRTEFGELRATEVTGRRIDAYIEASLAQGVAPATINRRLQILGQAFRRGFEADVPKVTAVPRIRKLPERNARQGFLEAAEFAALVAALPAALQDFARFAYLTGWRAGEIRTLRWEWVDRVGGVIRLPDSKNGRGRLLVIDGELTEIMKRREQARLVETPGGPRVIDLVFHRAGRPIIDYRKAWARACVIAGLYHVERDAAGKATQVPDKLFHDLRRTSIRNMVRRRVPETVAMQISGHRTRAVFDRYNITSEDDLRAAMQSATLPPPVVRP